MSPKKPRKLWVGLQLLDRQIICHDERLAGNVDDLELTEDADGRLLITGIYSGPGALSRRFGRARLGAWIERMHAQMDDDLGRMRPIPFERVLEIGSAIRVDADYDDLPDSATEKWVHDHVIAHIPGHHHEVE
jgi:hypothetical protein